MLQDHFSYSELFVNCKRSEILTAIDNVDIHVNLMKLAAKLELIRLAYGKPILINSAYRDTSHNRKVGGVVNSNHLRGCAADITAYDYNDFHDFLVNYIKDKDNRAFLDLNEFICYNNRSFIHFSIYPQK